MLMEDHSVEAKSLAIRIPPGALSLLNLFFCIGGLICAAKGSKSQPASASLRRAIALTSGLLVLPWLVLAANPH